ncbi:hypothetical protein OH76DRAFT_1491230 [Lentinus brumalis]|uniref:Uncharacterized protein n=1 Tax=Lentinus brumalis TaxID=2498619 RepID=A0A371CGI1_9APHY|nr:hypothetical protein OH76DRAFT_1491230 [Polyporus brumalis]
MHDALEEGVSQLTFAKRDIVHRLNDPLYPQGYSVMLRGYLTAILRSLRRISSHHEAYQDQA